MPVCGLDLLLGGRLGEAEDLIGTQLAKHDKVQKTRQEAKKKVAPYSSQLRPGQAAPKLGGPAALSGRATWWRLVLLAVRETGQTVLLRNPVESRNRTFVCDGREQTAEPENRIERKSDEKGNTFRRCEGCPIPIWWKRCGEKGTAISTYTYVCRKSFKKYQPAWSKPKRDPPS